MIVKGSNKSLQGHVVYHFCFMASLCRRPLKSLTTTRAILLSLLFKNPTSHV